AESSVMLQSARPSSSQVEVSPRPDSSAEALPTVAGDVRETFDPLLLDEVATGAKSGTAAKPKSVAASAGRTEADALGLIQDSPRRTPRRQNAAEARSQSRRCPTCGTVVPSGMSLCSRCGLDLESGTRVSLEDDLGPPPPPRTEGLPLPVTIIGGIALLGS